MFLKSILSLATITLGITLSAHASANNTEIKHLTPGSYSLISGDPDLCVEFDIKESDKTAKTLLIGANQIFATSSSTEVSPSDIDKNCEFQDTTIRKDLANSTVIKLINKEICNNKVTDSTTTTLTIEDKKISLKIEVPGAKSAICKFVQK